MAEIHVKMDGTGYVVPAGYMNRKMRRRIKKMRGGFKRG